MHKDSHGAVKRLGFALEMDPSSVQSTAAVTTHVTRGTEHQPRATGAGRAMHGGEIAARDAACCSSDPQPSHTHIRGADNVTN